MSTPTANSFLMSGGGSFVSFKEHGDTITGRVIDVGEPYQEREWNNTTQRADGPPKFTKAGKPVYAFHVTLETDEKRADDPDDDGVRVLDVRGWRMQQALRDAIRQTGSDGLHAGDQITVSYTHDEVPGDNRSGKNFQASYTRAANATLMSPEHPTPPAPSAATPAQTTRPAQPTQAPAATATPAENPAEIAKQMAAVGLDATAIAAALTAKGHQVTSDLVPFLLAS